MSSCCANLVAIDLTLSLYVSKFPDFCVSYFQFSIPFVSRGHLRKGLSVIKFRGKGGVNCHQIAHIIFI